MGRWLISLSPLRHLREALGRNVITIVSKETAARLEEMRREGEMFAFQLPCVPDLVREVPREEIKNRTTFRERNSPCTFSKHCPPATGHCPNCLRSSTISETELFKNRKERHTSTEKKSQSSRSTSRNNGLPRCNRVEQIVPLTHRISANVLGSNSTQVTCTITTFSVDVTGAPIEWCFSFI